MLKKNLTIKDCKLLETLTLGVIAALGVLLLIELGTIGGFLLPLAILVLIFMVFAVWNAVHTIRKRLELLPCPDCKVERKAINYAHAETKTHYKEVELERTDEEIVINALRREAGLKEHAARTAKKVDHVDYFVNIQLECPKCKKVTPLNKRFSSPTMVKEYMQRLNEERSLYAWFFGRKK